MFSSQTRSALKEKEKEKNAGRADLSQRFLVYSGPSKLPKRSTRTVVRAAAAHAFAASRPHQAHV
jgi:hypothetical protein